MNELGFYNIYIYKLYFIFINSKGLLQKIYGLIVHLQVKNFQIFKAGVGLYTILLY